MPFTDAVMMGQARDGGLLIPAAIPNVTDRLERWANVSLYVGDIPRPVLDELVRKSYANFDSPDVTPIVPLGELSLLELFHGPTLAFKDVALQFLGNVFEHVLKKRGGSLNILAATSGDTGSAGIYGVQGKEGVRIFVMYPKGRTSPVQELQMTTVLDENVHCLAIDGSFDECQRMMKKIFNDLDFKQTHQLGAINSINCARLLAQIVYYFFAYFRIARTIGEKVSFAVPTGNFGDIFAGYLALKMGLPIHKLILATNENDILCTFFEQGLYRRGPVRETLSPSMDIQVASNFERYLYYRLGEDPRALTAFLRTFDELGEARLSDFASDAVEPVSSSFVGHTTSATETLGTISNCYREHGYILDPHTAVGVTAGQTWQAANPGGGSVVCLATAHPAKFSAAVEKAIGKEASHPVIDRLAGRASRVQQLPADVDEIQRYIRKIC